MSEPRLRANHLGNFVEEVQQGIHFPLLKFLFPILHLRHATHVMYGECSLQPLTHDELSLVEEIMSGEFTFPSFKEAKKLRKMEGEKKRK